MYGIDANNYINNGNVILALRSPKVIARVRLCGGLNFSITDDMEFERPTEEQRENLRKTFGIEVELVEDEHL
jgi:hypothetical protein